MGGLKDFINKLLPNIIFQMYMSVAKNSVRKMNNDPPQCSALGPLLFNIYTADLTVSKSPLSANAMTWLSQFKIKLKSSERML